MQDEGNEETNYIELADDIYYSFECKHGHRKNIILQERNFEILFELGSLALIEGFTREAVSSFAASLERFYEFVVFVILLHHKVEWDEMKKMWKPLENQSERQIGAFKTAFTLNFLTSPPSIEDKKYVFSAFGRKVNATEFRNKVIQGRIPKYEEVLGYGESVKHYISDILKLLYTEEYNDTHLLMTRIIRNSINFVDAPIIIYSLPTIMKWTIPDNLDQTSLAEDLETLKKHKEHWIIRP
ncbi:hypothetical protein ACFQZR_05380 [Paenibacillus sp. GCM10027629]|uniref:hypothetical protein n=1 Tax=Paenibacillus sp. GCM10027629 TaxID=3273414 RepID=UPI00362DD0FC